MNFSSFDWRYIMEMAIATIAGALIAVAGTIFVNWLGNRKGYKDIDSKIGTLDNTTLSGQHSKITEDIKKSIDDNAKGLNNKIGTLDNTTLSGQNEDIIKKVEDISQFLEKERDIKNQKNNLLGYDMQKINSSIDNLSGFAEIMKNIYSENSDLKAENHNLKIQNKKLNQEICELKKHLAQCQKQTQTYTNDFKQGMHL